MIYLSYLPVRRAGQTLVTCKIRKVILRTLLFKKSLYITYTVIKEILYIKTEVTTLIHV